MHAASSQYFLTTGVSTQVGLTARDGQTRTSSDDERRPTLRTYAEQWLIGIDGLVRPRTLEGYTYRLEQHVLPALGDRTLDELGVDDVLALIASLRARGYSGWTVRSILCPLSRCLNHAVRRDVIPVSPMSKLDRTERPAVWVREQRILNSDEIHRLLDAAPPRYRTLLATAIFTGLRQSELLGLKWSDIDLPAQVIHVRRALDRESKPTEPKTRNARRDVVLMPALARALEELKATTRFGAPSDWVFVSTVGTPLHWRNVSRRALKPALRDAGIELPFRWHDLRHTCASLQIAGGANVVFVSRQLGHGSGDITLRVYGHLFDRAEHAEKARAVLEGQFGSIFSERS